MCAFLPLYERIVMVLASMGSYGLNQLVATMRYRNSKQLNFEAPLTSLVWLTSIVSVLVFL
jgi:K(+)-stimulated pyrophosphate-energized sodium pump